MGRAGRDGLDSDCFLFYSWADVKLHGRFLDDIDDLNLRRAKWHATTALFRMVEHGDCRHAAILAHFGETIEPCAASCDVCTGASVEDLAAEGMRPERARGRLAFTGVAAAGPPAGGRERSARDDEVAVALFERLRALRKRIADEAGVPAYIVFNDGTLRAMAEERPTTEDELLSLPGVGPVKLERYGDAFLELCRNG
jgi:ATP-dependent DNA helicase RecQ